MEGRIKDPNELVCRTETRLTDFEKYMVPTEGDRWRGERGRWGIWNGNVLKLGHDDGCATINTIQFIELCF